MPAWFVMIEVRNLKVSFGHGDREVHAVRGVGFEVAEGEAFGLVGESGSGKTTVLRAIAGLNRDWSGDIALGGEALGQHRARDFYRRVQIVFQDPYGSLHPRHTIDDILGEPARIHRLGDVQARVVRALDDVGLGVRFRFRFPHQLSGGQRQRVAIARALMLSPRVLLLDEPTSALDVSVQAEVLNLLARLRAEHGLTYLLVSHNLAVVAHMCDRLAVMKEGEIVERLDVEQLMKGETADPYTAALLLASRGYDRSQAEGLAVDG